MGIAILVIFSIGLYQIGKWAFGRFISSKPRAVVATAPTQAVQSEVAIEQNWAGYEAPTFVRRGLPYPVLTEKVKAKRKSRKTKAVQNSEVDSFPMGDWTLFAKFEGENRATH